MTSTRLLTWRRIGAGLHSAIADDGTTYEVRKDYRPGVPFWRLTCATFASRSVLGATFTTLRDAKTRAETHYSECG
jgi:hypothetical protein